ncbi:hypothetical protein BJX99DRAFT_101554 [Aspergillus californicus]
MAQKQPPAGPKSPLERLPVEIIQDIFFRCLEVNLPRASLCIARALSEPVIYTWLIRLAFTEVDGDLGNDTYSFFRSRHFLPSRDVVGRLEDAERSELQTAILGCRWCTLPVIRKCQKDFVMHVLSYKRQHLEFLSEDWQDVASIECGFDKLELCQVSPPRSGSCDMTLRANPLNSDSIADKRGYRVSVSFHLGTVSIQETKYGNSTHFMLPYCNGPYLPDKLLQPPWTKEKLEFLYLFSSEAYIDDDESHPRAIRTLRQLIRDRDIAAFKVLMQLRVLRKNLRFPVSWPCNNDVFRAALRHADGPGDPFVLVLVEHRWHSMEPDDHNLKNQLLLNMGFNGYASG